MHHVEVLLVGLQALVGDLEDEAVQEEVPAHPDESVAAQLGQEQPERLGQLGAVLGEDLRQRSESHGEPRAQHGCDPEHRDLGAHPVP